MKCLSHAGRTAAASANEDSMTNDAADEIMERIVRSATQNSQDRTQPRERRRSRANRKSCMLEITYQPTSIYTW